jgi:hypothetical protein
MDSRRYREVRLASFSIGTVLVVSGCSVILDVHDPLRSGPCTEDFGCPNGQLCLNSTCQDDCTSDGDCAVGQMCRALRGGFACSTAVEAGASDGGSDAPNESSLEASVDSESGDSSDCTCAPHAVAPLACDNAASGTRVVLFGGNDRNGPTIYDDTWEFEDGAWTKVPTTDEAPRARYWAGMTGLCDGVLLFGGYSVSPPPYDDDTWEWTGADWTPGAPPPPTDGGATGAGPGARDLPVLATFHGTVVLFGGLGEAPNGLLADTWQWTDQKWTQLAPETSPPAREGAAAATLGGYLVVFGGANATGTAFGDTWLWDGSNWRSASPSSSPPARYYATMAAAGGKIVLFGGQYSDSSVTKLLNDTWTWDGSNWTQQYPILSPPARIQAGAASTAQGVVLFGGTNSGYPELGDTWLWSDSNWTRLSIPGPPARYGPAMAGF